MSVSPSNEEMKRIFEKSIRLLDTSQSQLKDAHGVIQKAVTSLGALNTGKVSRVNEILAAMNDSFSSGVDTHSIETALQELRSVLDSGIYHDASEDRLLSSGLQKIFENEKFLANIDGMRYQLRQAANSELNDADMASELLAAVQQIAKSAEDADRLSKAQAASVKRFTENIAELAGISIDDEELACEEILATLYNELKPHVSGGEDSVAAEDDEQVNVNHLLIEFVNNLSLHDNVKNDRKEFNSILGYPVDSANDWRKIISRMGDIVNDSISALEEEKQVLFEYVNKIIGQLAEFETYVRKNRDESAKSLDQTSDLTKDVNSQVEGIHELVDGADDLDSLQKGVQGYLDNIRKSVDENLKQAQERDLESVENFSAIITELVETQKESESLKSQLTESHTKLLRDDLTGLPNRMAFNERVNAEYNRWLRDKPPLTLAIWDIDHFKSVNDNYGHDVGDRVLKIVSKLVHSRVRKTDMFARYGGEEFVLLMPDTTLEPALELNNKLREKLAETGFHYNGEKCAITSSVGIATFMEGDTIEDVMKRADIALYSSKDGGRNQCQVNTNNLG